MTRPSDLDIFNLWIGGRSYTDIGKLHDLSKGTVASIIRAHRRNNDHDNQSLAACVLVDAGMSDEGIAKNLNLPSGEISALRREIA
ncbi:MAG: hypothetical protein AAGA08_16975 [Pseudomonadota bacterium]